MADQLTAFDLIFEGPVDDKPETIRALKAAFLVDLNFPIERVQEILTQTPAVIFSSDSEMELHGYIDSLKSAGAKVLLVKKESSAKVKESSSEIEFDLDLDLDQGSIPEHSIESSDDVPLFQFDDNNHLIPPAPKEPKTYEIPVEADDDEPIIPEMLTKHPVGPAVQSTIQLALDSGDEDLTLAPPHIEPHSELALGEPIHEEKLVESPIANALLIEDVEDYSGKLNEAMQEIIEEHKPHVPEDITAVSMVLQSLNNSLQFDSDTGASSKTPAKIPVKETISPQAKATQKQADDSPPLKSLARSVKKDPVQAPNLLSKDESAKEIPQIAEKQKEKEAQNLPSSEQKTKKYGISLSDVVIPILVGIPMILVGNWFYYSNQPPKSVTQYDEVAKSLSLAPKQSTEKVSPNGTPNSQFKLAFIGRQAYSDRTIDADVAFNNDTKNALVSIRFETPKPPELTAEQIGRREVMPPWVRRIDLDKSSFDLTGQSIFQGTPTAKIYVEFEGKTTRLIGKSVISGFIDQAKGISEITVQATYGLNNPGRDSIIRITENDKFQISLSGTVTARYVTPLE